MNANLITVKENSDGTVDVEIVLADGEHIGTDGLPDVDAGLSYSRGMTRWADNKYLRRRW